MLLADETSTKVSTCNVPQILQNFESAAVQSPPLLPCPVLQGNKCTKKNEKLAVPAADESKDVSIVCTFMHCPLHCNKHPSLYDCSLKTSSPCSLGDETRHLENNWISLIQFYWITSTFIENRAKHNWFVAFQTNLQLFLHLISRTKHSCVKIIRYIVHSRFLACICVFEVRSKVCKIHCKVWNNSEFPGACGSESYIRFCVQEYDPKGETRKNHLTNNSVQKKFKEFNESDIEGNMWSS